MSRNKLLALMLLSLGFMLSNAAHAAPQAKSETSEKPAKPEKPDKSEKSEKPTTPIVPEAPVVPETPAIPDAGLPDYLDIVDGYKPPETPVLSSNGPEEPSPNGTVPEPSTFLLLGLGGLAMRWRGRRSNQ